MQRVEPDAVLQAVEKARGEMIDREPRQLLRWARDLFGDLLMMSTAFGKSGMVILHMLKDEVPEIPVYFLDTGYHFPETLSYLEDLRRRWNLRLLVQRPRLHRAEFETRFGEKMYERDPDFCCHKNKVEPFRELFGNGGRYQAWITGVRRDQASTRALAEPIEPIEGNLVKIQPLAYWTRQEVEDYIARNGIRLHPLFDEGYASIGCLPCTRKSSDATNERAGRWAGKAKTECGLHTFWKRQVEGSKNGASKTSSPAPSRDPLP